MRRAVPPPPGWTTVWSNNLRRVRLGPSSLWPDKLVQTRDIVLPGHVDRVWREGPTKTESIAGAAEDLPDVCRPVAEAVPRRSPVRAGVDEAASVGVISPRSRRPGCSSTSRSCQPSRTIGRSCFLPRPCCGRTHGHHFAYSDSSTFESGLLVSKPPDRRRTPTLLRGATADSATRHSSMMPG